MLTTALRSSVMSLPKATPPCRSQRSTSILHSIPEIPEESLVCCNVEIGSGRFGSCSLMTFKDSFEVCVKKFASSTPMESIRYEASILLTLNTSRFVPHCFGIRTSRRALVMSNVSLGSQQISLYTALHMHIEGLSLSTMAWKHILLNIIM